ncbi:hypothetical protein MXB_4840 [Myxobolus squamalis]|nr:hypothetical protein MXB_4840 [Myxobolus squamalis]
MMASSFGFPLRFPINIPIALPLSDSLPLATIQMLIATEISASIF